MHIKPIGSNQTEISFNDGTRVLVSYSTPVAAFIPGKGYVKTSKRYSNTTTKHINKWLPTKDVPTVSEEHLEALVQGKRGNPAKRKNPNDRHRTKKRLKDSRGVAERLLTPGMSKFKRIKRRKGFKAIAKRSAYRKFIRKITRKHNPSLGSEGKRILLAAAKRLARKKPGTWAYAYSKAGKHYVTNDHKPSHIILRTRLNGTKWDLQLFKNNPSK